MSREGYTLTIPQGLWGGEVTGPAEFSCRLYEEVQLLKKALRNYNAKHSLGIGCGYGRLTPWIVDHSDAHYAVDPESKFLNDARRLYPKVVFRQAVAQSLPFPDDYFDLIVSWTVLQHVPPEGISDAVREIKRVAESSAVIILAEATEYADHSTYWEHSVEEWKNFFAPWKLV